MPSPSFKAAVCVSLGMLLGCGASVGLRGAIAESPPAPRGGVAVLDVGAAVLRTNDGLLAKARLKKLFDEHQEDLNKNQEELRRQRDALEREGTTIPRAVYEERRRDLERKLADLQAAFLRYQEELKTQQEQLTAPVVKSIVAASSRIAKKSGIALVVDKASVPYASEELDITDQVVAAVNTDRTPR